MKNYKKILFFICIIVICITLVLIVNTYAKYLSSANSSSSINVARWNIKVNNKSIIDSSDITDVIEPVFPGNDYIAANIIAPTAEGYFDLNFDFSNVDVSFNYIISANVNENSDVKDFIVTGYSIDNGELVNLNDNSTNVFSEDIFQKDNIQNRKIRIYIMWDDSSTSSMDNLSDTSVANTGKALFDVNITFTQLASNNN